MARSLQECVKEPDPMLRLKAVLMPYLDYALKHPHLFDYTFAKRRDDARSFPDDFRARRSPSFNVTVDVVAEGMRLGLLKDGDPYAVCETITAQQHGLIALYRGGRINYDETQFRCFYVESMGRILDGLKA